MSARRRGGDDLIVGSDFINMFIGPSPSVRSRRFPLVRADLVDPSQGHSSPDSDERIPSRQLRPPSEGRYLEDHTRRRTNNVDPNQKLSGLIKSQDRQNYRFETQDQHNSNKVDHSEDSQRRGETRFRYIHSEDVLSTVTEDAEVHGVMVSEARVFGGRTLPRTSSNTQSSVTTGVPTSVEVESTDSYSASSSDEYHTVSTEVYELNSSGKGFTIDSHTHTNEASEDIAGHNVHDIATRKTHLVAIPPKFSVSSSIKKTITNEQDIINSENWQNNQSSQSNYDATSTSQNKVDTEAATTQEFQNKHTQDDLTSSMTSIETSTESNSFTTDEESTTFSVVTGSDMSTEHSEDWSTKPEDFTHEPTVTANVEEIPDGAQFLKVGLPQDQQETAVKVVSVRVSSSVAQVGLSPSASLLRETTVKTSPIVNTISEEPSSRIDSSSKKANSDIYTLEIQDHPPVTSVERSELLVEESSPSEVTAVPFTSYTSFLSSNFQAAATTNYYQSPQEHASTSSHVISSLSQSSLTPTKSERRPHYFNHSPRNHRNPTIEALQRSSEDSPQLPAHAKANYQDVSPRRYAPHSLPRAQESILRQEPASVAESIQRSIITRQGADRSETRSVSSRSQFHQDKNGFANGGFEGEEARYRKRYSQPERVWGQPEKVYGEPEKVYGEPEKVYGEPEKVYGEPEKVYGEPEKNYEVDEAVSVQTHGRAHGVQPTQGSTLPAIKVDSALKMIDSKQQDPNHKFGYVVEGRNFRKYRVEERTSDGFIVGEYGVVSHDDGSLRGVRYTADESINPRLIYDTLVKFLSL